MLVLTRNPLVRVTLQLWWAPALLLLLITSWIGGPALALPLLALGAGLAAGVVGRAWWKGRQATADAASRRKASDMRFVCPACLQEDAFRSACPHCEKELEAWMTGTCGAYVDTCGHCAGRIQPETIAGLDALCGHCQERVSSAIYHHRQVAVRGALTLEDFEGVCRVLGEPTRQTHGIRFLSTDDGRRLTYFICLQDLSRVETAPPKDHVVRSVREIWTGCREPLEMVNAFDRFVARVEMGASGMAALALLTDAPAFDAAALRALRARVDLMKPGVSAADFLSTDRASAERETSQ